VRERDPAAERRMRCFIALEIPDDVRLQLAEVIRTLKTAAAGVKWVEQRNIHLTMKFLGPTSSVQAEAIAAGLGTLAGSHRAIPAALCRIGAFPDFRRPKVIWAGVDAPGVVPLQQAIETLAADQGYQRDVRPFQSHLTLGRLRTGCDARALIELIPGTQLTKPPFVLQRLALLEITLTPQDPVYRILQTVELRA
jgi:RNA 2',3'-cyclic 3'-phosphodiesterase